MSKQKEEMFPPSALDKLRGLRKELVAASEKADEAVGRAEAKANEARLRVYRINEVIEALSNGADLGSGEVS